MPSPDKKIHGYGHVGCQPQEPSDAGADGNRFRCTRDEDIPKSSGSWLPEFILRWRDFRGRSTRDEYWTVQGILFCVEIPILALASAPPSDLPLFLDLVLMIPLLALAVRRLHDVGWSGWWILVGLLHWVGRLLFLVLCLLPSQQGENQYGPNPYGD